MPGQPPSEDSDPHLLLLILSFSILAGCLGYCFTSEPTAFYCLGFAGLSFAVLFWRLSLVPDTDLSKLPPGTRGKFQKGRKVE